MKTQAHAHNPYSSKGGLFKLQHAQLVNALKLIDGAQCPPVQQIVSNATFPRDDFVTYMVGQTSDAIDAGIIAAVVAEATGVPILGYSETDGRLVVHLHHRDIPHLVFSHGNWTLTRRGWELALDRPEFWMMSSGTLKTFLEYHFGTLPDNVVSKKNRLVKVMVRRDQEQTFLAAANGRILQDLNGWFWVASNDESKKALHEHVCGIAQNVNLHDVLRHQALPKRLVNVERARN